MISEHGDLPNPPRHILNELGGLSDVVANFATWSYFLGHIFGEAINARISPQIIPSQGLATAKACDANG